MSSPSQDLDSTPSENPNGGKGRPTPKRKEREASNKRPLVPNDRKLAREQERARVRAERERSRVGMLAGDERYLLARDRGPQRKFVREYVDARFSIGELMIPVMVAVLLLSFIPSIYGWTLLILWGFFGLLILDSVVLGTTVNRRIKSRFGAGNQERGLRWYAIMRAMQMRRMRIPKPQNARGEYPLES